MIAGERVLRITPSKIGTAKPPLEIFYSHNSTRLVSEEIIGLSISASYASLFITIRNRGLFAFLLRGELLWSAGPTIYRFGYLQGCKKNTSDCYFNSGPVVDRCEGTLYVRSHSLACFDGYTFSILVKLAIRHIHFANIRVHEIYVHFRCNSDNLISHAHYT